MGTANFGLQFWRRCRPDKLSGWVSATVHFIRKSYGGRAITGALSMSTRTLSNLLNDPADANSTAEGLAATFSNSTSGARTDSGVAVGGLPTPALATTQNLLNYVSKAIWDDMLSGDPQLDHTAAVAAVLADTSLRSLTFPAGGIVNVDRFHIPATNTIKE